MLHPKKDEEFVVALLQREEGETLDFKQSITNIEKIAKTITAFANTAGGQIVIGISDNKQVIGIDEYEEMYMIDKAANELCQPPVTIDYELFTYQEFSDKDIDPEEKNILIVNIKKSSKLHYLKNNNGQLLLYRRVKDKTLPQN